MNHIIRFLLFDLGNVIVDIDVDGAMARLKQLSREDADASLIDRTLLDYECGRISTELFINKLLSQSQPSVQALDIIEAWNSMLVGIPGHRLDMLQHLRQRYTVALLSNTNALHLEWIHRHVKSAYQINDFETTFFDKTYYSHLIGDRKPNASIFSHVLGDAFLMPSLTLYLDDIQDNLDASIPFGFHTQLVIPGEEVGLYLKEKGIY